MPQRLPPLLCASKFYARECNRALYAIPTVCITAVIQDKRADLRFYKGGCPIHLKGAPEGTKPPTCAPTAGLYGGDVGPSPENLKI